MLNRLPHMANRVVYLTLTIMCLLLIAACDRVVRLPTAPSTTLVPTLEPRSLGPIDDQFRRVGEMVPTFGGFYVDGNGNPTLVLTNPLDLNAARNAMVAVFGPRFERQFVGKTWQTALGRFPYTQLAAWRSQLLPQFLALKGASGIGLDHKRNRITLGVLSEDAIAPTQALVTKLGVLMDAVLIAKVGGYYSTSASTLLEKQRPLTAGFFITTQKGTGYEDCSSGPNVTSPASSPIRAFFLTASHCTFARGVYDSFTTYQPNDINEPIGGEVIDAPYTTSSTDPNCPADGSKCQYADAALIQYFAFSSAEVSLFGIARTLSPADPGGGPGSTTIDYSYFNGVYYGAMAPNRVEGYEGFPPASYGTQVEKIGWGSGWTRGYVDDPCYSFHDVKEPPFVVICQTRAVGTALDGDSGGPVTSPWIDVYGVVSARGQNESGDAVFIYSPLTAIFRELGMSFDNYQMCAC